MTAYAIVMSAFGQFHNPYLAPPPYWAPSEPTGAADDEYDDEDDDEDDDIPMEEFDEAPAADDVTAATQQVLNGGAAAQVMNIATNPDFEAVIAKHVPDELRPMFHALLTQQKGGTS